MNPKIADRLRADQLSSDELLEAVIRLLGQRPMTTRELANATGADLRRVALAVRAIQRGPDRECLIILGVDREAAMWFIQPLRPRPQRHPPARSGP